ncbi:MAG: hypothetical protein HZB53_08310 [Chloroflexi bacterium]|nr:hypothetical protein [Chloroflexota bacterium]
MPWDPKLILEIITQYGVVGLLVLAVVALVFWIEKRTVPRMAYETKAEEVEQIRTEMNQIFGPGLEKLTALEQRQVLMHEELFKKMDAHSVALASLVQDVRLISYEINHRRIDSPNDR